MGRDVATVPKGSTIIRTTPIPAATVVRPIVGEVVALIQMGIFMCLGPAATPASIVVQNLEGQAAILTRPVFMNFLVLRACQELF